MQTTIGRSDQAALTTPVPRLPATAVGSFLQSLQQDGPDPALFRTYVFTLGNFLAWLRDTRPTLTNALALDDEDLASFLACPSRRVPGIAVTTSERLIIEEFLSFVHRPPLAALKPAQDATSL